MTIPAKVILCSIFSIAFAGKIFAQSENPAATSAVSETFKKRQDGLLQQKGILDLIHQLFHKKGTQDDFSTPKQFNFSGRSVLKLMMLLLSGKNWC